MSPNFTTKNVGLKCAIQIAANANLRDGDGMLRGQDVIAALGVTFFFLRTFIHWGFIHDERLV